MTWLIRLIVQWSSHSVAPAFFGSAMKTDFSISFGTCPVLYISLRNIVIFEIPNSSRASICSIAILSGPVAFPHFFFVWLLSLHLS